MSLINRVLHDLEDRHAFPSLQPQSVLSDLRSAQEYAQARRAASRPVLGFGVFLMLAAAVLFLGRELPVPMVPVMSRLPAERAPAAATAPRAEKRAPVAPVSGAELRLKLDSLPAPAIAPAVAMDDAIGEAEPKLLNFDVLSNGDGAAISLVFTSPPRYSLHVLERPSRLLVQMPRIEMSPLRDLAPVGLVDRLRFGGDDTVSKVIFDLNQPVEIDGTHVAPGPGGVYRLEIRLSAAGASDRELAGMELSEEILAPMPEAAPEPARVIVPPAMEVVRRLPPPVSSAESDFQQGAAAYRVGDMAAAIDSFHRAVLAEPGHLKARRFLVAVLVDQGDMQGARRFAEEGLKYRSQDPVLLRTLARIHFEQGDPTAALEVLARSEPALQDDPDYYALKAAILQGQSQHGEAADLYGRLLQLDPQRGIWWGGFGISLEALGRPAEARAAFERAQLDTSAPVDLRRYAAERIASLRKQPG